MLVARIEHQPDGNAIGRLPGSAGVDLDEWAAAPPQCDHCSLDRRRRETYLLRADSLFAQVGTTCLLDFTGGHDPARALQQVRQLADAERPLARTAPYLAAPGKQVQLEVRVE